MEEGTEQLCYDDPDPFAGVPVDDAFTRMDSSVVDAGEEEGHDAAWEGAEGLHFPTPTEVVPALEAPLPTELPPDLPQEAPAKMPEETTKTGPMKEPECKKIIAEVIEERFKNGAGKITYHPDNAPVPEKNIKDFLRRNRVYLVHTEHLGVVRIRLDVPAPKTVASGTGKVKQPPRSLKYDFGKSGDVTKTLNQALVVKFFDSIKSKNDKLLHLPPDVIRAQCKSLKPFVELELSDDTRASLGIVELTPEEHARLVQEDVIDASGGDDDSDDAPPVVPVKVTVKGPPKTPAKVPAEKTPSKKRPAAETADDAEEDGEEAAAKDPPKKQPAKRTRVNSYDEMSEAARGKFDAIEKLFQKSAAMILDTNRKHTEQIDLISASTQKAIQAFIDHQKACAEYQKDSAERFFKMIETLQKNQEIIEQRQAGTNALLKGIGDHLLGITGRP
jgi:hypothetical protein